MKVNRYKKQMERVSNEDQNPTFRGDQHWLVIPATLCGSLEPF